MKRINDKLFSILTKISRQFNQTFQSQSAIFIKGEKFNDEKHNLCYLTKPLYLNYQ